MQIDCTNIFQQMSVWESALIRQIRRLSLQGIDGVDWPDAHVAVEVLLADGSKDLIIAADAENPMGLNPEWQKTAVIVQKDADIKFKGELCWIRWDANGIIYRVVICKGQSISIGTVSLGLKEKTDFIEICFKDNLAEVDTGPQDNIEFIKTNNRDVWNK